MSHDFFFQAFVYLAAAVVSVPIAKRLGMGAVLGYLVAGVAIGPFGLALLGTDSQDILHFAEFGVVMMLFVVGLELEPSRLWRLRGALLGLGGLQVLGTAVAVGSAAIVLGITWKPALATGFILAMSSTAIVLQSLTEKGLLKTEAGERSFAVLLFQDIAVIPLLALLPLLASTAAPTASAEHGTAWIETLPAWSRALATLGAVASIVAGGRWLVRPVFGAIARTRLQELFTAAALLLVVGITLLMTQVGLSPALGTFLAGVVLANSEYRHELETDIEPFKGLLMGLFFMAVGMSIDFGLLRTEPLLTLALVLGFQLLKGLSLAAIARPVQVAPKQRWLFAALLAQGGEFAFVVFGVARSARLLPGNWDARLTLAVALSMALTPLLLFVERKLLHGKGPEREPDAIPDEGAHVIIAGFGRFGQIVGRLLFANGIKATVLDHDPEQIDLLRRFAFRIYYGDASRIDLLHAAGAARADVLVNAIDDPETNLRLVDAVKEHFPNLKIVARARDVGHYYKLRLRGIEVVERETFEAALVVGRRTLEVLGVGPYEAREYADRFRRQNVSAMERIFPHWHDEAKRIAMARSAREELEKQFEADRAELAKHAGHSWHPEHEPEEG
ncbi:MAG TPA: glutathione-regulated potassium-efflux system protein KefC [Polyangiaceae bacterium]|nr:glutathione-regulated potassium-efflux system protein KefC [Polyangiaceae bacterium]